MKSTYDNLHSFMNLEGKMKFLCIHGVGHQEVSDAWIGDWRTTIAAAVGRWDPDSAPEFDIVPYDKLFEDAQFDELDVAEAIGELSLSGIIHGIGDLFRSRTRDRIARGRMSGDLRWTGGMVAQWVADEELRATCSARIAEVVAQSQPDVLVAHSLGSLLVYDALRQDGALGQGRRLITFGSQIGNAAVRRVFGGRLEYPAHLERWFHLYNRHDNVFTAPLPLSDPRLVEIDAEFDDDRPLNHSAIKYLSHATAVEGVWQSIATEPKRRSLERRFDRALAAVKRTPTRRALLVGINDYPDPADRLEGCVNDVFEVSASLQELGFDASEIRVVLNERATAANLRDRLQWLLEDVVDDDIRFFFYSGHGAQIPGYGAKGEIDAIDECLVPYDFAWTSETAVIDDWFQELYSQLPYGARFYVALDCCHSGGMTRSGARKARGLEPPDDIRHRLLRWDSKNGMWVERDLPMSKRKLVSNKTDKSLLLGDSGALKRLGSAVSLWSDITEFNRAKNRYNTLGPYAPVMLYACKEKQLSYEYRHGIQSYGAFTYALTQMLRDEAKKSRQMDFNAAIKSVARKLKQLGYDQTPQVIGPEIRLKENMFSMLAKTKPF
jgi:metacaspase-1